MFLSRPPRPCGCRRAARTGKGEGAGRGKKRERENAKQKSPCCCPCYPLTAIARDKARGARASRGPTAPRRPHACIFGNRLRTRRMDPREFTAITFPAVLKKGRPFRVSIGRPQRGEAMRARDATTARAFAANDTGEIARAWERARAISVRAAAERAESGGGVATRGSSRLEARAPACRRRVRRVARSLRATPARPLCSFVLHHVR